MLVPRTNRPGRLRTPRTKRRAPWRGPAARRGTALVFVVVAFAVVAVGATVIFPFLRASGVDPIIVASDQLFRFKTEIIGPAPSFFERVQRYPGNLSDLTEPITTSDVNSCGNFYSSSPDVQRWRGPYHLIPFNRAAGYTMAYGILAQNATARTTFTNGADALAIVMNDVQPANAQALKLRIDGTTGDTVAFTPDGDNPVTVHYRIPTNGAC